MEKIIERHEQHVKNLVLIERKRKVYKDRYEKLNKKL
jgi:hypothetical protein